MNLLRRHLPHHSGTVGGTIDGGVVQGDDDTVGGGVQIQLDHIGADVQSILVGDHRVLRSKPRTAAMSDVQHPVFEEDVTRATVTATAPTVATTGNRAHAREGNEQGPSVFGQHALRLRDFPRSGNGSALPTVISLIRRIDLAGAASLASESRPLPGLVRVTHTGSPQGTGRCDAN
jgi:hypothetical protein